MPTSRIPARVWVTVTLALILLIGCTPAALPSQNAASQPGKLDIVQIPAPSLANNALREPAQHQIGVYLPPSYGQANHKYPVVYFLTMFGAQLTSPRGAPLVQPAVDAQLAAGKVQEMIVVVISGFNALGGSFYANSPVTGNWEDFVVRDVVDYVDAHYRTLPTPASRGISGHSMGGSAALRLAMQYPDRFGAVYALSPALFDPQGLSNSMMFASPDVIAHVLQIQGDIRQLPPGQAVNAFNQVLAKLEPSELFTFAYGSAFAPAADLKPPYIIYPYHSGAAGPVRDDAVWAQWNAGFGALDEKVQRYQANLKQLAAVGLEYGKQDENAWIPPGCQYLSQLLTAAGIPHTLDSFDGKHYDQLAQRFQGVLLPFFSQHLKFEGE